MGRTCGGGSAAHAPLEAARYGGEERDGSFRELGAARQVGRVLYVVVVAGGGWGLGWGWGVGVGAGGSWG